MNKPPYAEYPKMAFEELVLRKVEPEDIPQLMIISYYDGKQAANLSEAGEMQEKIDRDYENGESIHWVIEKINSREIVGTCGYYRGFKNDIGELGCILLPRASGFGYMTRAMQLAINFGFKKIMLKKIIAVTSAENLKARKLLNRQGFILTSEENDMLQYELLPGEHKKGHP